MKTNKVEILDCTLRDGSYVLNYNFNQFETSLISRILFESGINYVEVGHGVGIGANLKNESSFCSDEEYIQAANLVKKNKSSKVGSFCFSSNINYDQLYSAKKSGLDFIRFGVDPKSYKKDLPYINYCNKIGLKVFVNFVKSYSFDKKYLCKIAKNLSNEGAHGAYIVDSAGGMLPNDVKEYIEELKKVVNKKFLIGFHGHNNLGLANANCLSAIDAGANIIDSSMMGMGRSSGNAITEMLVAILDREKILKSKININLIFDLVANVILPIYPKKLYDEKEILIGKSYFHSSFYPQLVSFCKKNKVSPKQVLQNFSFKKNFSLDNKFKKKIINRLNENKKSKIIEQNIDQKNIEYINFKSFDGISDLKKIIISEKFKKNCNVALTVCRTFKKDIQIKNIYSSNNIILGHIESPNLKTDLKIISNFSKYFIFFDEKIFIKNKYQSKKIFSYSERKILEESVEDFINFSNYANIFSNNARYAERVKKLSKNKKSTLLILDDSLKNTEIVLKKMSYEFDILVLGKLKQETTIYKKKYPLIKKFYKPNYGIYLCSEISKKISLQEHIKFDIGNYKINKKISITSGGQIENKGSVIVNSIKYPNKVIGISDGKGGLTNNIFDNETKRNINKWFLSKIRG